MNPDRRRQLERRRLALQERLRREERLRLIADVVGALDGEGLRYDVVYETDGVVGWVQMRFPIEGLSIDWGRVPGNRSWGEDGGFPDASELRGLTRTPADVPVEVLTGNGRAPALRLQWGDAVALGDTLASYFEVWVVCQSHGWVLEYTWLRGWTWGRTTP